MLASIAIFAMIGAGQLIMLLVMGKENYQRFKASACSIGFLIGIGLIFWLFELMDALDGNYGSWIVVVIIPVGLVGMGFGFRNNGVGSQAQTDSAAPKSEAKADDSWICKNCGARNKATADSCKKCGKACELW